MSRPANERSGPQTAFATTSAPALPPTGAAASTSPKLGAVGRRPLLSDHDKGAHLKQRYDIQPRRHDQTGRSTVTKRRRGKGGAPKSPWVPHTAELLRSSAWRGMTHHARLLLEFLEIEHMQHGGRANGDLVAPYNQLKEFGIGRRFIAKAIRDAEQRGLIRVRRGGKKGTTMYEANRFWLTYLPHTNEDQTQEDPVDDWRRYPGE